MASTTVSPDNNTTVPATTTSTPTVDAVDKTDKPRTRVCDLPQELYDIIYAHVFTVPQFTVITIKNDYKPPPVLQVSHATRRHLLLRYCLLNKFSVQPEDFATWYLAQPPKWRTEMDVRDSRRDGMGERSSKTVVVTGASGGIGRATAVSFAKAGAAKIALLGRRQEALEKTRKAVEAVDSKTQTSLHICDSTDADAIQRAANTVGSWDVLVLNAGVSPEGTSVQSADLTAWWSVFETNVKGTVITAQAFLPHADLQSSPSIISVNAALPFTPNFPVWAGKSAYNGSKIALASVMHHLAQENPSINVVSVHPGIVDTDMMSIIEEQKKYMKSVGLLDEPELPADFFVWLSTFEAGKACSGKFVFANWDVEELMEKLKKEEEGSEVLTLKLDGWPFISS
ncbi:hypothetical protein PRZ48_014792 [Zasmidium cellare]|uniref:Ketoreductase domain-containing protein n=1 Tax=Zasmidium cellare TaxID=395010 RepID=A0ABR0DZB2_ZASCE|nr:hypothetical protein PRZ48_014792 [Zasmidium cellare]